MPNMSPTEKSRPADPGAYAVLRRGGASASGARRQMALSPREAANLERVFSARIMGGGEQSPRFARHAAHVKAVMAEGGFPTFVERRGPDGRPMLTAELARPQGAAR
jgi:hypothetical protein